MDRGRRRSARARRGVAYSVTESSVDLRDRVAIVTGGGRGIGGRSRSAMRAPALTSLISAARNPDEADRVVALAEGLPGSIQAVQADVTAAADVGRLVERALALSGTIDVLVNNAARGMRFVNERFMTDPQPFWEADPAAWQLVIETNIVGVFLMSRAVVPHMLAAGRGSIINVTINHADDDAPRLLSLRAVEGGARGDDALLGGRARRHRRRDQPAGPGRRHRHRDGPGRVPGRRRRCSTRRSSCAGAASRARPDQRPSGSSRPSGSDSG